MLTNGSTEAPNGLIIAASPRGGGTSTVVALDLKGKVVWRTEEWTGDDGNGDGIPDLAGVANAVASSAGIQAPMVDSRSNLLVQDFDVVGHFCGKKLGALYGSVATRMSR